MLCLASVEPEWLELLPATGNLPAVEAQFAPIGIKAVRAARRAVAASFGRDPEDLEQAGDELSRELIRRGLLAWRGVGDTDGKPIEVSPETIELFVSDPRAFEAADRVYVLPWVKRDAEKNASSASPNGTGEAETQVDVTANSAAKPGRARAAKPARTKSTSRKPTKA